MAENDANKHINCNVINEEHNENDCHFLNQIEDRSNVAK